MTEAKTKRCAIYARKSHEEGLDMEFNSLDAQREAAEAYILSQKTNGWKALPKIYSDGGFTGANTNRPALRELLADIKAKRIDIVVVYKIDRLSRSLIDFAELQTVFDGNDVSFVSVTQQIDTSTSAGRMMLNILMTFAQFERETIAERIRDKFAASRKKGMWMGGSVPYGYRVENKKLVANEAEKAYLQGIFQRYAEIASARQVAIELNASHIKRPNAKEWTPEHVYSILGNHTYLGKVMYKGTLYEGEHEAMVTQKLWDDVHERLDENAPYGKRKRMETLAPLKGVLRCGHCGGAMSPAFSNKDGRRYSYYQCAADMKRTHPVCPVRRVSAEAIERIVFGELGKVFKSETFIGLMTENGGESRNTVLRTLSNLPAFWKELFPVERNRLVTLLLESAVITENGLDMTLKTEGMKTLIWEMTHDND